MKATLILIALVTPLFGFAGGGGSSSDFGGGGGSSFSGGSDWSSSSSSDGDGDFLSFLLSLVVMAVIYAICISFDKKKSKRTTSSEVASMARTLSEVDHNNTEQEKWLHKEAERIFRAYQEDWSTYNLKGIQEYTTDRYFQHACLMLEAIDRMSRRNVVSDLTIGNVYLLTPFDDEYELPAKIVVAFIFGGTDGIVDTKSGRKIHSDKVTGATEYWNFAYDGNTLKLDEISQSTESSPHLVESIRVFADQHKLFYSSDWGRLALPTEGLIFNDWVLSSADVNNHVVGRWNDCLVQMYTYSATPADPSSYYLVGQINMPKSYEGVILEAKKAKLKVKKPDDYEVFEMEWNDFNHRYKVYAASRDAVTAFELLNPSFMENLYNRDLPYNLEVKGNTIYIFSKVKRAVRDEYEDLFEVLVEAYKELKR